ncbi:MAG: phosphoenolpyruvate--protein phosphotransferase, partial [Gammaproteobacteria bacterium]|nr:phosphoenolpyruvate--protein phosphotransferase [Gammaproteobacteria bacterium]
MSLSLSGIGVSRGVAIGKAHIILRGSIEVLESTIPEHLIDNEIARFLSAVDSARLQLQAIQKRIPANTGVDIAAFIETHLLMLDDAMLVTIPVDLIREHHCNAEWALKLQRDAVVSVFEKMDDAYLRTRRDDIDHVINRIQRFLLDSSQSDDQGENIVMDNAIVLAYDLTPAESVMLEHQGIKAFATECGGPLSHTAIHARSMQIPAMVGTHGLQRYIQDGETVILDGLQGVLIAAADEQMLDYYRERQEKELQRQIELAMLIDTPAVTRDGTAVRLMANIELPEDIDAVSRTSANGVGLYRTEFLYMNRLQPPDEEEQYDCYVGVIEALKGKPLTIRTLDMGADKQAGGIGVASNPALGLRAIRLCLKNRSQFTPQLRAILRASAHGPVRLMIPMLSNTSELHEVLALINDTKISLQRESLGFAADIQIGGMIEVPAAALTAADFASHLDFLSIGTNDLIRYTVA